MAVDCSTIFAPLGTEKRKLDRLSAGLAVQLVITTCRLRPFAVSTSNCLMLESLSSIQTFALVKRALERFGVSVTAWVDLPPTLPVPDALTLKRERGESRNSCAGSTASAFRPV